MLNPHDHERLTRSQQTAHLLADDLRGLARAEQPLLAAASATLASNAAL